jgi:hypothetical protein
MDQQLELTTNEELLVQHAEAIRVLGRRTAQDVIEIGRRLSEAKEIAGHGRWLPWLEREFGWSDETARKFMRAADVVGDKFQQSWDLPVSALYLLAAPSTPDDVREQVVALTESGEQLSLEQIKQMVDDAKVKGQTDERAKAEKRLAEANRKHEAEVARLRESSLPIDELTAEIEKRVQPLVEQIDKYKKRLEKLQKKEAEKPGPANEYGLQRAVISGALRSLASNVTITPAQMIEAQKVVTKITGQPMLEGLGEDIANAQQVAAWVDKFITATKGIKK